MVLTAKDWGFEDTKKWFEGMCRYELNLSEKTWDLVIVPLFDEIFGMEKDIDDLEKLVRETEQARDHYKNSLEDARKEIVRLKVQVADSPTPAVKLPKEIYPGIPKIYRMPIVPTYPGTLPYGTYIGDPPPGMSPNVVWCDSAKAFNTYTVTNAIKEMMEDLSKVSDEKEGDTDNE